MWLLKVNMNNKTILFIDDEQDALDRLRYLFEGSFTCYYAATGESGLRLF